MKETAAVCLHICPARARSRSEQGRGISADISKTLEPPLSVPSGLIPVCLRTRGRLLVDSLSLSSVCLMFSTLPPTRSSLSLDLADEESVMPERERVYCSVRICLSSSAKMTPDPKKKKGRGRSINKPCERPGMFPREASGQTSRECSRPRPGAASLQTGHQSMVELYDDGGGAFSMMMRGSHLIFRIVGGSR